MDNKQVLERIEMNPKVMLGKPVIKDTRIPVELIVRMVAQGIPEADILAEYPRLNWPIFGLHFRMLRWLSPKKMCSRCYR